MVILESGLTGREHNLARWFADKITSESTFCSDLKKTIVSIGFNPSGASLTVTMKEHDADGNQHLISYEFRPVVINHEVISE